METRSFNRDTFARDTLAAAYPATPNSQLATQFGVSQTTILKWAARYGLRTGRAYKRGVQAQNGSM